MVLNAMMFNAKATGASPEAHYRVLRKVTFEPLAPYPILMGLTVYGLTINI